MPAMTAFAPLLARTSQVWIRGKLWHATRLSCRVPVEVLTDTEVGGGTYTSLVSHRPFRPAFGEGNQLSIQLEKGFSEQLTPQTAEFPQWRLPGPA